MALNGGQQQKSGYQIAQECIGLREDRDRRKLEDMFHSVGLSLDPSTTAWCAAFMNYCEITAGKPGTHKLNAQSFDNYEQEVPDLQSARQGDILVFRRGSPESGLGHVTYFSSLVGDGSNAVNCLGGNQSEPGQVCIEAHSVTNLITIRRS